MNIFRNISWQPNTRTVIRNHELGTRPQLTIGTHLGVRFGVMYSHVYVHEPLLCVGLVNLPIILSSNQAVVG